MLTPDFSLALEHRRLRTLGRALNRAALPLLFVVTAGLTLAGGWHLGWWLAAHAHWSVGLFVGGVALVDAALFLVLAWRDATE